MIIKKHSMGNFCNPPEELNTSDIFNEKNQSVTFYLHKKQLALNPRDLINFKKSEDVTSCTISFDGRTFKELAYEQLALLIDTPVELVKFKIISLFQEKEEQYIDNSNLRGSLQNLSSYDVFYTEVEKHLKCFEDSIFIAIVALPWSLHNNNFDWSSMTSYYQYDIEHQPARNVLSWAFQSNREYGIKCNILMNGDNNLDSHTADQHIQEISRMMFCLYHGYHAWVIPTITSIRFILHLLKSCGVSDIIALGVGNGLPECILANEAKRIGQPLTIYPSDSVYIGKWDELHRNNKVTSHHSVAISDTYIGKYYPCPITIELANVAVCRIDLRNFASKTTLVFMWCRAVGFSVDALEAIQDCYPDKRIYIVAYTTGEEYVNTPTECEPESFYELARKYGYTIAKFRKNSVLFQCSKQEELEEKLCGTILGCTDYLMVLHRDPVKTAPKDDEFTSEPSTHDILKESAECESTKHEKADPDSKEYGSVEHKSTKHEKDEHKRTERVRSECRRAERERNHKREPTKKEKTARFINLVKKRNDHDRLKLMDEESFYRANCLNRSKLEELNKGANDANHADSKLASERRDDELISTEASANVAMVKRVHFR